MKKKIFSILPSLLLILPNSMSYFSNVITNQTGIIKNKLANPPNNSGIKYYDINKDGSKVTPYLRYGNANNKFWIYQIWIRDSIFSYRKIEFKDNIDVWASWGNTSYHGSKYIINDLKYDLSTTTINRIANKKMETSEDVNENSLDWFRVKEHYGPAVVQIVVRFQFTWYYYAPTSNFYFQIGIYMYGETWASLSGGGIWVDLGKRLIFYS